MKSGIQLLASANIGTLEPRVEQLRHEKCKNAQYVKMDIFIIEEVCQRNVMETYVVRTTL